MSTAPADMSLFDGFRGPASTVLFSSLSAVFCSCRYSLLFSGISDGKLRILAIALYAAKKEVFYLLLARF